VLDPRQLRYFVALYDAVAAEADLELDGVRSGSSLKTLGHEETGLRI
jgi:hypothetical protein